MVVTGSWPVSPRFHTTTLLGARKAILPRLGTAH